MKKIGMIGMGWVGGSYARDFTERGFQPVCYSMEPQYVGNKDKIKECDIVFICVPTPTTQNGFDDSILRNVMKLVGDGKTAVIKSTVLPGMTASIQAENPNIVVLHAPEFLLEVSSLHDASHPKRNIIGMPLDTPLHRERAEELLVHIPQAPYNIICSSIDAELIKYARNCVGYFRVIFYNLLHEIAVKEGANWENVRQAVTADPDNGPQYTQPIHKSGRGAGGSCFIKDFAAFTNYYESAIDDPEGLEVLRTMEKKNIHLLTKTNKDLHHLKSVYGDLDELKPQPPVEPQN